MLTRFRLSAIWSGETKARSPSGERFGAAALQSLANDYFFKVSDKETCKKLLENFYNQRSWPMLPNKDALEKILREGIDSGVWVAYKMPNDIMDDVPNEFYAQKKPLPYSVSLLDGGYSVMTVEGARKRGWTESDRVSNDKVKTTIKEVLQSSGGAVTYASMQEAVRTQYANVEPTQVDENLRDLMQGYACSAYIGTLHQTSVPYNIVDGFSAFNHEFEPDEVIITKAEQTERGWTSTSRRSFTLEGNSGAKKIVPILKRIGSLYTRSGAKCTIDSLDITDMKLPGGAKLRISVDNASADDIKRLDEFFQAFCDAAKVSDETECDLRINNPEEDCAFLMELKK